MIKDVNFLIVLTIYVFYQKHV